jgi:hypothetical protein
LKKIEKLIIFFIQFHEFSQESPELFTPTTLENAENILNTNGGSFPPPLNNIEPLPPDLGKI